MAMSNCCFYKPSNLL